MVHHAQVGLEEHVVARRVIAALTVINKIIILERQARVAISHKSRALHTVARAEHERDVGVMRARHLVAPIAVVAILHAEQRLTRRGQHTHAIRKGIVVGQLVEAVEVVGLRVVALLVRISGAHIEVAHSGGVVDKEMGVLSRQTVIVALVGRLRELVAVVLRACRQVIDAVERKAIVARAIVMGVGLKADVVLRPEVFSLAQLYTMVEIS